ncbi:hypothetical protein COV17_04260 [Candidatus Woesearchaeota archaeon CG10_big_fil_rev_8_21_14_0_10_36_11]|nr:MAG: hypothetical protein COV17_04260 [Candidatus Woesearchaeota archaeon CG10_big_fil_rev_8_21_14_0_10_36_11]
MARVPGIGEPLARDEHLLVYERKVGKRTSLNIFDFVVVGVRSFLSQHSEAIRIFDKQRFGNYEWLKITTPFAGQVKQAHVATYGRF